VATSFQRELLPPAKSFYEHELGKLSRPVRGWSRGNCPFHKSKSGTSFSVNLESGGFHCFGCDAKGGDVLAFVRLRDHLDFKSAAKSLGAWRDVSASERIQLDAAKSQRDREREKAEAAKEAERRKRLELRDQIHAAHRNWQAACVRLAELRRGAMPTSETEEEACWSVLSLAFRDLHETESAYCKASGLDSPE
jgi:hypothetical protein